MKKFPMTCMYMLASLQSVGSEAYLSGSSLLTVDTESDVKTLRVHAFC